MNCILSLQRAGCPWRYLPRDGFPPRSTVYNTVRKFQREGAWEAIWAELYMALREQIGREVISSAAVLDSQSVKSAEKGGGKDDAVGYDAGKKVKGRKIQALVDTEGLPMRALCCTDQQPGAVRPPQRHLWEANVLRPPEFEHAVQRGDGNGHLGHLPPFGP